MVIGFSIIVLIIVTFKLGKKLERVNSKLSEFDVRLDKLEGKVSSKTIIKG